ncbi:MAG: TetR/AcrR family transcriptional regulator [Lachnospira sp.]|nr:TetR/AcrR family transcriptional regulator [Lachnospira sp.]
MDKKQIQMEKKILIIDAALEEFNEKGLKFTMDDIAKRIGISKKTIYKVFTDKETLFNEAVDRCYSLIKECEHEILTDDSLDDLEKLKRVLIVLPDRFKTIDWRRISSLMNVYPEIFNRIINRIDSDWEPTLNLIEKLIEDGRIRNISIPIFRLMTEASIKAFISNPLLIASNISYEQALDDMVDILISGIENKE